MPARPSARILLLIIFHFSTSILHGSSSKTKIVFHKNDTYYRMVIICFKSLVWKTKHFWTQRYFINLTNDLRYRCHACIIYRVMQNLYFLQVTFEKMVLNFVLNLQATFSKFFLVFRMKGHCRLFWNKMI